MTLFHDCYESNQTTVCLLGSIMRQFRSGVMTTTHPSPREQNYESDCSRPKSINVRRGELVLKNGQASLFLAAQRGGIL